MTWIANSPDTRQLSRSWETSALIQIVGSIGGHRCNSNQNVGCLSLPASAGMEYLKSGMDVATMLLDISVQRMALNIRDRVSPSALQSLLAMMVCWLGRHPTGRMSSTASCRATSLYNPCIMGMYRHQN
jgi:hypothetical protein